jgi:aminoglycoside/choline kinase family phosphotransferase/dTDP-glucose pyrophosphorylase
MKALILAAGYGTRLLPYTKNIPKPLFTLSGKPVLQHTIEKLIKIGCDQIFINTHHLHEQIDTFLISHHFSVDIRTVYEPVILGTGGAIANLEPFLNDEPFFVINSDVVFNSDLKSLYDSHNRGNQIATLLLHDCEKYNKITIDDQQHIKTFFDDNGPLAFTGIQVVSPEIYHHFSGKKIFSTIEVYECLCCQKKIKAFVANGIFWEDIGTSEDYTRTALNFLTLCISDMPVENISKIIIQKLAGDGSDRKWYRVRTGKRSWVISDHGICTKGNENDLQLKAFINIGNHLFSKGIRIPEILFHDPVSGMVALEDLGDTHLESKVKNCATDADIILLYKNVCDLVIQMSTKGFEDFDVNWTCQTKTYSKEMILRDECKYFMESFLQNYLKKEIPFIDLLDEFEFIAHNALKHGFTGLMHRDMQSRNIMVKDNELFLIDFQSARTGPLQYDLASLFIDPYVNLNDNIKQTLLHYVLRKLKLNNIQKEKDFKTCYNYCCLTRNLQFLGAFSFLIRVKGKKAFEKYIPESVISLKGIMKSIDFDKTAKLNKIIASL